MRLDNTKLGKAIKSLRMKRDLTQSGLAALCHVEPNTIARLERGESQFTIKMMNLITDALNVPVSFLTLLATDEPTDPAIAGLLKKLQESVHAVVSDEETL